MEFRTQFKIEPGEPKIDYNSSIFLVGSCFVDNIGEKLEKGKFKNLRNPFGIFFHPAAIENFLSRVVKKVVYTEEEVFFQNERWHCFEAHSVLSNPNKEELVEDLNGKLELTGNFLKRATHIIITLGTSYGYKLKETNTYVANCHKVPQARFDKELMPVEELRTRLQNILNLLKNVNPQLKVIFTVSPIRHLRDGVVENQVSKAHLLSAVSELVKTNPEKCKYFPSYELMMDDLRDYRFYKEDMIHPTQVAIDYIWNKFKETWISKDALLTLEEINSINQALNHKPFNPNSEAHLKFLSKLNERIKKLKKAHPELDF
ncbi:MAG TPA: GSCFA domain-containing protein [Gillisia sp.]|nr:GSCFA domain-containing protein [Gillisia sp.]